MSALYYLAVAENFGFVSHGIGVGKSADNAAGVSCGKAVCGYRTCDDASRAYYAAVAYGNAGKNGYVGAYPAAVADMDGFCVAQTSCYAVGTHKLFSLVRKHRVQGSSYGHVGTEIAVVADSDLGIVLARKIKVEKGIVSDFCMLSVVESDRALEIDVLAHFSEYFADYFPTRLGLILGKAVVFLIEHMRSSLDLYAPFVVGAKHFAVIVFKHFYYAFREIF